MTEDETTTGGGVGVEAGNICKRGDEESKESGQGGKEVTIQKLLRGEKNRDKPKSQQSIVHFLGDERKHSLSQQQ